MIDEEQGRHDPVAPTRREPADLPPAARRALEEAALRRARRELHERAPEQGGRGGLEPVRYGDWEVKGLASDF